MTVEDFMEYSIEDDCPDNYLEAEVCTFDVIDKNSPRLTLNVTLE